MAILRGRDFTDSDRENAEPVIVVDENLANNFWPGENPLTKCVTVGTRAGPCRRVIGIVAPSHFANVVEKPSAHFFVPTAQNVAGGGAEVIVIRLTSGGGSTVGPSVRRLLAQHFGDRSRPRVRTMEEIVGPEMRAWRVGATLFTGAGVLALIVAAVGIYSCIAYSISQRAQEMGVRVALGANEGNIMRLVVGEGVRVVAIGVGLGMVFALALGSVVASMLYETSPRDPFVLITATTALLLVAVVACAIPAWRAARVDPLSAMRAE
jgi:putative ABC transport system permease protein